MYVQTLPGPLRLMTLFLIQNEPPVLTNAMLR
jgi:hypothetical protein